MISYVIPYFNGSRYVKETIASVLAQDVTSLEVLVIDDSSDELEYQKLIEIVSTINDSRIRLISNSTNLGLMATLNEGVQKVNHEVVAVLGQDDMVPNDHARLMLEKLMSNPSMALCFCDAFIVLGDKVTEIKLRGSRIPKKIGQDKRKDFRKLWKRNFIVSTGLCLRRTFFLEEGGFDSTFKNYGEWLTWLRISTKYEIGFQSKVNTYYRKHSTNITNLMFGKGYWNTFIYNIYVLKKGLSLSEHHSIDYAIFMTCYLRELLLLFYKKIVPFRRSDLLNKFKARKFIK